MDVKDVDPGQRVQTHPATDEWMSGDKYGTVVGPPLQCACHPCHVSVKMDRSGRVLRFRPEDLLKVV